MDDLRLFEIILFKRRNKPNALGMIRHIDGNTITVTNVTTTRLEPIRLRIGDAITIHRDNVLDVVLTNV